MTNYMKATIKYLGTLLTASMFFVSCEGLLDRFPQDKLSPETFLANETEMQTYTNSYYTMFLDAGAMYNEFSDVVECIWLFKSKPDILHFRLHAVETEPVGERDEHEHCFAEDLVSLMLRHEFYGPAVVETVCKLDEYYTNVIIEGEEDTLEVLGLHTLLHSLVLVVEYGLDLCQSLYKRSYFVIEKISEVIHSVVGVFYDIVEERCYY